eukprot:365547-Chlamydomonas_euryale.AAC.4
MRCHAHIASFVISAPQSQGRLSDIVCGFICHKLTRRQAHAIPLVTSSRGAMRRTARAQAARGGRCRRRARAWEQGTAALCASGYQVFVEVLVEEFVEEFVEVY